LLPRAFDIAAHPAVWTLPLLLGVGSVAGAVFTWRAQAVTAVSTLVFTMVAAYGVVASIIVPAIVEPLKPMPILGRAAGDIAGNGEPIGLYGRYGWASLNFYSKHDVILLNDEREVIEFLSRPGATCVLRAADFTAFSGHLTPAVQVVAYAQEFNVRIEHLLAGRPPERPAWVLVSAAREPRDR
jgi:hypothetical protein